ncbi:MAG: hypothetical protein AAGB29_03920 [Planctomycetota bacterium]
MADLPLSSALRCLMAEDLGTPRHLLERLAADGNLHVRRTAARNPRTPGETIALLCCIGASAQLTAYAAPDRSIERGDLERATSLGPWSRLLVARHPGTPAALLDRIRIAHGNESAALREAIAAHPHCPRAALCTLCVDASPSVRRAAGTHPGLDRATLDELVAAGASADLTTLAEPAPIAGTVLAALARRGPWGRVLAARHPDTPPEVIDELAGEKAIDVRLGLASNPAATEKVLRRSAEPLDKAIAERLAEHPTTPADLLIRLAALADIEVRARVADHPRLAKADGLALRLAVDGASAVRERIARRDVLSREELDLLAAAGAGDDLLSFGTPDTAFPAESIDRLASLGGWGRHLAARHPATSPTSLAALLTDGDPVVRLAAVSHPHRPRELLALLVLAGSEEDLQGFTRPLSKPGPSPEQLDGLAALGPWARRLAARHPDTPPSTLIKLADDEHPAVRTDVARHPATPDHIVMRHAGDALPDVRWAVARREGLPRDVLDILVADPLPAIRLAVLGYADTAPDLVARLRQDLDADVRDAANATPIAAD